MRTFSACLLALSLWPLAATAQDDTANLNTEFFQPSPGYGYLGVREARVLPSKLFFVGAMFNFAQNPLLVQFDDGSELALVGSQTALDLTGAIGLQDWLELGIALPLAVQQSGEPFANLNNGAALSGGALGDVRLAAKVRLVGDSKEDDGFYLSFTPEVTLPSGNGEKFFGAAGVSGRLALSGQVKVSQASLTLSAGPRFQKAIDLNNLNIGNSFDIAAGGAYLLNEKIHLLAETNTSVALQGGVGPGQVPAEVRAGARFRAAKGVWIPIGVGVGLSRGVGSPDFRLIAGINFSPEETEVKPVPDEDPDRDGIVGAADQCPTDPEDKDNVEDEDGCPEDNDKDGIADKEDVCPGVPGLPEFKGCPDTDGDKISDVDDKCPKEPGLPERQGCPKPDRDKDTIADDQDPCPTVAGPVKYMGCPDTDLDGYSDDKDKCIEVPEDFDKFEDEDGCYDPDNDQDQVVDKDDLCPTEKEDGKGKNPKDGCPDTTKATIVGGKIVILDKVFFDVNKDTLQKKSYPVLDAVYKILSEHPEIKKLEIQGHTDDQGKDDYNLDLSDRRAKRVKEYLVKKGIEEARLEYKGYGETKPLVAIEGLDPKKDKKRLSAARDQNRRVEFVILEQSEQ